MNNEKITKTILGASYIIDAILDLPGFKKYIGVSDISRKKALEDAKQHLDDYLIKMKIQAKGIDSFKLICCLVS